MLGRPDGMNGRVIVLSVLLVLGACQTPAPKPQDESDSWLSDTSRFKEAEQTLAWRYTAKVGLVFNGKTQQANLTWQRSPSDTGGHNNKIRLFGPLGVGAIKLEFSDRRVLLTDNHGREYHGTNAQALLTKVVGWPLPLNALSDWLLAQPMPNKAFRYQVGELDRVSVLSQLGWRIEYHDWRDYQGRSLPRKIIAKQQSTSDHKDDITVKLITKAWQWHD